MNRIKKLVWAAGVVAVAVLLSGCKDRQVEAGLESDANGFVCVQCSTKFYTERELFPDRCPQCKGADLQQVIGFVCPADQHATLAARNRGARKCEKCGGPTSGVRIPNEAQLKAWGAVEKTKAEVGGS